jgi:tetratricopeptide (TPR) repeat protein
MSIQVLLDLIRQRFSPSEGKILVTSLSQDPLVWRFIQNEVHSLEYFNTAPNSLEAYSPGHIASWCIQQETGINLPNLMDINAHLPKVLKQRAAQTYETTYNTGLPPADLFTAGLLALALRERRITKENWSGIAEEILQTSPKQDLYKNFLVWRTPLACLLQFCPDYNDLITEILKTESDNILKTSIPIIIHALLTNPLSAQSEFGNLSNFVKTLNIDYQLEALKWLDTFNKSELCMSLAKQLIQTKSNIDFFATVFSEYETYQSQNTDPLTRSVRFTLAEDLNRVAALNYFSGNTEKAKELYQNSSKVLDLVKNQTFYQSLVSHSMDSAPSEWLLLVKSLPKSKQARILYIRALIDHKRFDDAKNQLEALPESIEKKLLTHQLNQDGENKSFFSQDLNKLLYSSRERQNQMAGYFAHTAQPDPSLDILSVLKNADNLDQSSKIADDILERHGYDSQTINTIRDIYIKAGQLDKAITLTSYLDLMEPEKILHKQNLAALYTQAERWPDAYSISQQIIRIENNPKIEDMLRFAKSAMKTDHVDIGISICQNILQQESNNSKALVLLGEGYMLKGDPVKAIQHMEQVVEMIPNEADTWLTLAHLWEENGQTDRSFEILNKGILALPQNTQLLHAIGKAYLNKQAPSDAHNCLKKALEIEPKNTEIQFDLAQAKYELGEYDQALALLEPFRENYQQKPSEAKLLGHVLLAMDEKQSAEPILLFAAETFPQDVDTVLTAVRLTLERIEASQDKVSNQELERLQALLKKAIDNNLNDDALQLHLADVLRLKGEYQDAFDAYLSLSEKDQQHKTTADWRFSYGLGQAALALGDYEVGLAALQEAHSKQPSNTIILRALSEAYQAADLFEKAQQTAKSALKMAPQDIQNILWYAHFKSRSNEPQEAVKALKEALQIMPDRPDLQYWLSKFHYANGDNLEAINVLKKTISHSQSSPKILHQAAYLGVQLNELDLAVKALEKAKQLEKDIDATLLMDLSLCYTLLEQRKKALEVLDLSESTIEQYPQLSMLKSDLLCELGQYQLAFKVLKSVEGNIEETLNNDNEEKQSPLLYHYDFSLKGYHYRVGQLLRALGEIKESQEYLSKALDCDPSDMQIRNACAESFAAGLNFEKVLAVCDDNHQKQTQSAPRAQSQIDLSVTQTEHLLLQGPVQDAQALFNEIPTPSITPRTLAFQSQLAFVKGDSEDAVDKLHKAIDAYAKESDKGQTHSLQRAFREFRTLSSIAEAALNLEEYSKSLHFHKMAADIFNNQPCQNLRHATALIKAAASQQIASLLHIRAHAPGEKLRSDGMYEHCQSLIEKASPYLPEEKAICLKSQCVAAYTGTWPRLLNIESCLRTPEVAALVLINTDEEEIIQKIMGSFSENPLVCQAYGLHALRFNKDDGVSYIEKALKMDVSNPINHALLAFLNKDVPELALKSLKIALNYWPNESGWHAFAGELYQQLGETNSASQHIARALETEPENAAYWQKSAEIKLKNNALQEAKEDLEKSVSIHSEDPQTWTKMADVNRRLGNSSEALQNLQKASQLAPEDKNVITQEIKYLLEQKRFADAENKVQEMIERGNGIEDWHILLAKARAKQRKFELALEGLKTAASRAPQNQRFPLEVIKTKKERDGVEAVLPELITLAQDYPEDPDILTTLTDWLIQTNRLKEAEEAAQTILRIIPEQAVVHLMLGRLQRKAGQLDQAISHFSDSIQYDPNLIEAYIELGKTYQDRRDLEQAIKVFQKGAKVNIADPRPYYHAGMALKDCKDYAGAEAMLKQAKKYAPDDPIIIRQLGVITALNLVNNLRETR